ncbi:MAG: hypothetical protein ACM3MB_10035 [Acidobacteriota bacterium]
MHKGRTLFLFLFLLVFFVGVPFFAAAAGREGETAGDEGTPFKAKPLNLIRGSK